MHQLSLLGGLQQKGAPESKEEGVSTQRPSPTPIPAPSLTKGEAMLQEWGHIRTKSFNLRLWRRFFDEQGCVVLAVLVLKAKTDDGVIHLGLPALDGLELQHTDIRTLMGQADEALDTYAASRGVRYATSSEVQCSYDETRFSLESDPHYHE